MASLWKVDDDATAALMAQFYTNLWTRKLPKLEALRQAQLALLDDPTLVERHRAALAERGLRRKHLQTPPVGTAARAGARSIAMGSVRSQR